MDIVERLRRYRPTYGWPEERSVIVEHTLNHVAADEIERLREDRAELLEALKFYACDCQCLDGCSIADCGDVARKAIAKATGDE